MVALPSDVARSHKAAKHVFQTVFLAMASALERSLPAKKQPRHINGQALAALCVGGMVVARAMVDNVLADKLREACMAVALDLGGWQHHTGRAHSSRVNAKSAPVKSNSRRS